MYRFKYVGRLIQMNTQTHTGQLTELHTDQGQTSTHTMPDLYEDWPHTKKPDTEESFSQADNRLRHIQLKGRYKHGETYINRLPDMRTHDSR